MILAIDCIYICKRYVFYLLKMIVTFLLDLVSPVKTLILVLVHKTNMCLEGYILMSVVDTLIKVYKYDAVDLVLKVIF